MRVPATCKEVKIRLQTVTNAGVTHWTDVCVFAEGAHEITLPWWVREADQVQEVFRLRPETFFANNVWNAELGGHRIPNGWAVREQKYGDGRLTLWSPSATTGLPMFFYGKRPASAYSSDTEEKHINGNYMNALLAEKVYNSMNGARSASLNVKWIDKRKSETKLEAKAERISQSKRIERQMRDVYERITVSS